MQLDDPVKGKYTGWNEKSFWTYYKKPWNYIFRKKNQNDLEHHDQDGSTRTQAPEKGYRCSITKRI